MNTVQFRYDINESSATIRPYVDGFDLLASYRNDHGLDPDRLLPPLSTALLPTKEGRRAVIGACSCGETCCGSLSIGIRRLASDVLWEPVEVDSGDMETITRGYRFDLVAYLDAVDRAGGDPPAEGRGRRVARMVRLALGHFDQTHDVLTVFQTAKIDWIEGWPWTSEVVRASVTTLETQEVREFHSHSGESDAKFAGRVARELHEMRMRR